MNCYSCGTDIGDQLGLCPGCRQKRDRLQQQRLAQVDQGGTLGQSNSAAITSGTFSAGYSSPLGLPAGFWLRALASSIDSVIISLILNLLSYILKFNIEKLLGGLTWLKRALNIQTSNMLVAMLVSQISALIAFALLLMLGAVLYYVAFESSKIKATPGKRLIGLEVQSFEGHQITFSRALFRYFAKIISAIPFGIGFLIVAFHPEKFSFHDIFSKTRVVKNERYAGSRVVIGIVLFVVLSVMNTIVQPKSTRSYNYHQQYSN